MINKEDILEKTNRGLDVFKHYLGFSFKPGKNFRNPLYDDRNASCNIYYDRHSHSFKMKDFGNEDYSGDCFSFVAKLKGWNTQTEFTAILNLIVSDLKLNTTDGCPKINMKTRNSPIKEETNIPIVEKSYYKIETKSFSSSELSYWERYGISHSILRTFHVYSIQYFNSTNKDGVKYNLQSKETDPIFAFTNNGYVKIYRPLNRKNRFLYGGELPEIYCFGLEQLPNKGDIVFITGGEKDVMSLYAKGFYAICFNSETASIPTSIIEMLERRFKHIVILYDSDETGRRESLRQCSILADYNIIRLELPLSGEKKDKDISDYFLSGKSRDDFRQLIRSALEKLYSQTLMFLKSCEMDYNNPPQISKIVVSIKGVPLGTYDNLLCITGGEGSGKSNFVSAILAGTLCIADTHVKIDTLGLEISPNYNNKAILHYDTEQSEYQLYKNLNKTLKRSGLTQVPETYHTFYLASMARKERLQIIRDSMDLYYHKHGGIHLIVIDGIADLIRSANDETESIAIVDELYRLAGIYNTCIINVLHYVPNGIKLRGHIGSELQRKAAAIISIEKDENPMFSVVKAIKVRDGSPLDIPLLLFKWDNVKGMHIYAGEKSDEEKEKRKVEELINVAKRIFYTRKFYNYTDLVKSLIENMNIKERTAKNYIRYMKDHKIINQDDSYNYIIGICN